MAKRVISCFLIGRFHMGVYRFTSEYEDMRTVSFHMPGHKGSEIYRRFGFDPWLRNFPDRDITEIAGADNLFQAEGIIAETMERYRDLYDTRATYLLINGSSAGIIASIMNCAVPGEKIIMARNCHKAVYNGIRMRAIEPIYVYPEVVAEYGIAGQVNPEDIAFAIRENPDAKAIILPSPNYYGICSDIGAIADLAHEAGMILIVDQAHGAHLKIFEEAAQIREKEALAAANIETAKGLRFPVSAETAGADLIINSTHKTLASMTQSAILNVCSDRVDLFDLEDRLQMIQSTSPSYILMESLDINGYIMREHGDQLIEEWYANLMGFYHDVKYVPGLKVMRTAGMDPTKINLDMSRIGLDGAALDEELRERGVYGELFTGDILMCMTGIGNTRRDYERLLKALKEIAWKYGQDLIAEMREAGGDIVSWREGMEGFEEEEFVEEVVMPELEQVASTEVHSVWTKRREMHGVPAKKNRIPLDEAAGQICARSLIPYPPGIPLVCPGEEITEEDVDYVRSIRDNGGNVIGIDPEGNVSVG